MKNLLIILASLLFISCNEDDETTSVTLRVDHYKQTAVGVDKTLVLLVQENKKVGTDDWNFLYSDIQGFEYEMGYVYDLIVIKHIVRNPPADGSSVQYSLKEINSKVKVGESTLFEIELKSESKISPSSFVSGDLETGYSLLGEIPINCDTLCNELAEALDNNSEVTGQFVHQASDSIKLINLLIE